MRLNKLFIRLGLIGLFLSSCEKPKEEDKLFELLPSEKTGISFSNELTSTSALNILDYLYFYNGGGVAAGDINNDGLIDLYFTGNQVSNKLYLNQGDFKFKDITDQAEVSGDGGWSTGVTMADVNGDGFLDIYVTQVGNYLGLQGKNKLYINQGDLTFKESAADYGIDFQGFGTHAAFFDYDRDGDLDLYLLNHGIKSPEVFVKAENRSLPDESGDKLFKNLTVEGGLGFEEVTEEAGIYSSILGFGLGLSIEDFNGDGWPDIYVSNDFTENDYLYLNNQDGTFTESLEKFISNTSRYSMGNDAADLNGDGLPEIITTDMLPEVPEIWMKSVGEDKSEVYKIKKNLKYGDQYVRNHLQLNRGEQGFSEIALYAGVFASDWSWSPLLFDMDNDGLTDLHISNGIVKRANDLDFIQYSQTVDPTLSLEEIRKKQIDMLPKVKLANYSFQHTGKLKFEQVAEKWGLDQPSYSNGSTYADLDNDGDLDLIINNIDQEAFIYQNRSERLDHHFLKIKLKSSGRNSQAIGAEVKVFAGNNTWRQRLSTSRGFQSGTPPELVFGLGETAKIDSIIVQWPEGILERFEGSASNQELVIEQGSGIILKSEKSKDEIRTYSFPIAWTHQENTELDESTREYLIPKSFANRGPAVAMADVNGDGLDDLYLGGAKDQAGSLFIQQEDGSFRVVANPFFEQLAKAEDVVAEFADLNGDGVLDLYVASGGNEVESGNLFLFDRVFFGDGKGNFSFSPNSLPPIGENTSAIAMSDVNGDGALDIFVGVSNVSGDYGANPKSYLLINNGAGRFREATSEFLETDSDLGMINSALWTDVNQDGKKELILTGDWQNIRVFSLVENKIKEVQLAGLENSSGWINTLKPADVNGDGLVDLIVGNLGLNSKLKASIEQPLWLYHADFDQNGQSDPLIFHYMEEKLVPFATRDDLIKQIPSVKRLHPNYATYAEIESPESLFGAELIQGVNPKKAVELRSGVYFQQADGSFDFEPFPWENQLSPIQVIHWNESTHTLSLGGNEEGFRVDLGRSSAQSFYQLKWTSFGWENLPLSHQVPLHAEVREILSLKIQNQAQIWVLTNNGPVYQVKLEEN
ncbi:Repeat domain-containing protein [Algoriphagus faecimaris]|uniref:Repeat domain-containing protein n=1 Tax=Algoriphagus faecimaris TaxID=686796 RepID=A0A1G6P6L5_9BACT|nr:VCBS repeat-containing protein [Algoriphagus faecimaris]SDC75067.1 Repeat domain-containing protein [Algoriphagus faecimaris]